MNELIDQQYKAFEARISKNFNDSLFKTENMFHSNMNVQQMYDLYLKSIPETARQYYTCNCCKTFLRKYGNLVCVIPETNEIKSAIFVDHGETDDSFKKFETSMARLISKVAKITTVFVPQGLILGYQESGGFSHMHVDIDEALRPVLLMERGFRLYDNKHAQAVKGTSVFEFKRLTDIVTQFRSKVKRDLLAKALLIARSATKINNQKTLVATLEFFSHIVDEYSSLRDNGKDGAPYLWRIQYSNPGVFKSTNTTMFEFVNGLETDTLETVIKRYNDMTHGTKYCRPVKLPSSATKKRAEEIVADMGIEDSLRRRSLRRDEIAAYWSKPEEVKVESKGVFDSVRVSDNDLQACPTLDRIVMWMTFEAFLRDIVPTAKSIKVKLYDYATAIGTPVTAAVADSKPIVKYDSIENRKYVAISCNYFQIDTINGVNVFTPCTHFRYRNTQQQLVDIDNIFLQHTDGTTTIDINQYTASNDALTMLNLSNSKISKPLGLGLFPNILIPELYEVRSVIEAFSNNNTIEEFDNHMVWLAISDRSHIELVVNDGTLIKEITILPTK